MVKGKRVTGTKEWSSHSVNCIMGCSHDCRYCYARAMALRFGRIESVDDWSEMKVRAAEVSKRRHKMSGHVMFPTTHDITPDMLVECTTVLQNLLASGNQVLVVSKPHISCIEELCCKLRPYRRQILFRFTIGARSESILSYWEPGAPSYEERFACLRLAAGSEYATSVSCEPLLDSEDVMGLYDELISYITDSIWFGKMNAIPSRVVNGTNKLEVARIRVGQTDQAVQKVYRQLCDKPKVRWKESYKEIVGLELASEIGLDV